jgi:hypothetical protein
MTLLGMRVWCVLKVKLKCLFQLLDLKLARSWAAPSIQSISRLFLWGFNNIPNNDPLLQLGWQGADHSWSSSLWPLCSEQPCVYVGVKNVASPPLSSPSCTPLKTLVAFSIHLHTFCAFYEYAERSKNRYTERNFHFQKCLGTFKGLYLKKWMGITV